jgi:2-polyprenyl-3-methyl-5-hydroxy-6-metoxy-1,4-benzoquinol methylase
MIKRDGLPTAFVNEDDACEVDNEQVLEAFARPEWYLRATEYNIRIRAETVMAFVDKHRFESILDIGCGNGSLSLPLLSENNYLTLLDQSKAMLNLARSRIAPQFRSHVAWINTDFMAARLEHKRFDLIICVGVLAYVRRRHDFVTRVSRLLKPGGSVIVECTDVNHFISRLVLAYDTLHRLVKPARMRTVLGSSTELLAMFGNLGFKLCQSYRYSLPLPLMRKLMTQRLSYKAIRFLFGTATHNRNKWLGNECIFHFKYQISK